MTKIRGRDLLAAGVSMIALALSASSAVAGVDEARKWLDGFQPSTLSKDEQMKELEWFVKEAEPYKGMDISVVSETLTVHEYESQTLAKAFAEIPRSKVKHTVIQESELIS